MLAARLKTNFYRIAVAIGQRSFAEKVIGIIECEKVTIKLFGGKSAEQIFKKHTAPHRMFPFIGSKTLGVALSTIPEKTDAIFKGNSFREARRKRNRARQEGFACEKCSAMKFLEDIYAIHTSTPTRQGRPLDSYMTDFNEIRKFCDENEMIYGVFDHHGKLKAYAQGVNCGEVFVLERCIGHYDSLNYGVMFLLIYEVLVDMVRYRQLHGVPLWIQHDMFFARTAGARQFKKEAGFRPYKVKWLWRD